MTDGLASTNASLTFEAELPKRLRWRGLRRFLWLQHGKLLLAWFVVVTLISLLIASSAWSIFSEVLVGLGLLSLLVWILFYFVLVTKERKDQQLTAAAPQRFNVSRNHLEIETKFGVSVLHWYLVTKAKRYHDMWLLVLGNQSYVIIPSAGMPPAVDDLLAHITSAAAQAGECPKCGYALRGLSSDRCPECGTEISAFARELASSEFASETTFNPESKPELNTTIPAASPLIIAAIREYNLWVWIRVTVIVLLSTTFFTLVNHFWWRMNPMVPIGGGLFCFVLITFSLYAAMQKVIKTHLERSQRLEAEQLQIRVSVDGFQLSSAKGVDQRSWEAVKRVRQMRHGLAITSVSGHSIVIPSAMPEPMLAAFLSRGASLRESAAKPA